MRGASDFTLLLTSFGVHFVVSAIFLLYVSASVKTFDSPGWINDTYSVGPLNIEVFEELEGNPVQALWTLATASLRSALGLKG